LQTGLKLIKVIIHHTFGEENGNNAFLWPGPEESLEVAQKLGNSKGNGQDTK
jgi:hypothetical protein